MNGSRPIAAQNAAGTKLHLQHGPIDLIIIADASPTARQHVFAAAQEAMADVLSDLVAELSELRRPSSAGPVVHGPVARRMVQATCRAGPRFVTPMAAVAGAVADHVVSRAMSEDVERLIVNNGGDIAFALGDGASTTVGLVDGLRVARRVTIHSWSPVRGVATSGWRGRSHSLGIADAVTTFAADGAAADAAASVIASAIDLPDHPGIARVAARELDDDSDLGDRLVTVGVAGLSPNDHRRALANGAEAAVELLDAGVVHAVFATLGEQWFGIDEPGVCLLPAADPPELVAHRIPS